MNKADILGPGTMDWLGTLYRVALPSNATDGALSIVDTVSAIGSGPPRHVHEDADETFLVLSGEIEWWLEGRTGQAGPGDALFVPRGAEHTFRVIGGQPCRHVLVFTPGGFERFFEEMATRDYRIPEDMEAIASAGKAHALRFTGPPLGGGT